VVGYQRFSGPCFEQSVVCDCGLISCDPQDGNNMQDDRYVYS